MANFPFVPMVPPEGYGWVPARRAEFGSNLGIYQELPSRRDGGLSPFRHNPVKEVRYG